MLQTTVSGQPAYYLFSDVIRLGKGGMNAVLRGNEVLTRRTVILRRHLPAESAVEEEMRTNREALVQGRLTVLRRHPAIPRFWASGSFEGERCEVFDFAPGISLMSYVVEKGLTYGALLDFAFHAARGLLSLHKQGLIHGDVKPENFCVEERVRAKGDLGLKVQLIDFDIVSTPDEQIRQYALGTTLEGTLPYMPPENFRQDVPEDPQLAERMVLSKDVFALGLTLYRIVSGRFPESFYTSPESLLMKKVEGVGIDFDFPSSLPLDFQELIGRMCATEWILRPRLPYVVQALRRLRSEADVEERATRISSPENVEGTEETTTEDAVPGQLHVGPYAVLNWNFSPRVAKDGQTLPLAALKDRFGRKLVGVPYAFETESEERSFYEERVEVLKNLNAVRLRHPELFPGSFRDLVREMRHEKYVVWIIRPLLEDAKDLRQFLCEERPGASSQEKLRILRKTAEALAVLDESGFHLPQLTPELIFFIPLASDVPGVTLTRAALTRPIARIFDVPAADPEKKFRQELMGTASVRRGSGGLKDPTVAGFFSIAEEIGLLQEFSGEERILFNQIRLAPTWRERLQILILLEMQSG